MGTPSKVIVGTADIYTAPFVTGNDPVSATQVISWLGWRKAGYKTKDTGVTVTHSETWYDKEVEEHNSPIDSELVEESCVVEFELAESDAEQFADFLRSGTYAARDTTKLNGALDDSTTAIPVELVTGFLTTGTLLIGTEQITYTAVDATNHTFGTAGTPATRGANGSSAVAHSDLDVVMAITALSGAIDDAVTIIPVDNVDHAPAIGAIQIDDEQITYATVDLSGETFGTAGTAAVRAANGTTKHAHDDNSVVYTLQSNTLGIGDKATPGLLSFAFAGKGVDSTDAQGIVWYLPKVRSDGDRGITFHKAKDRSWKIRMFALIDPSRDEGERLAKVFEVTTA